VLIISLRTLLAAAAVDASENHGDPQRFDWVYDESRPLPVSFRLCRCLTVMLTGERESLADFQEMEPELAEQAVYSEYEDNLQIADADTWRSGASGSGRC
jgi:Lon-like ATP-dependent protease